jgi:TPR repeat protein
LAQPGKTPCEHAGKYACPFSAVDDFKIIKWSGFKSLGDADFNLSILDSMRIFRGCLLLLLLSCHRPAPPKAQDSPLPASTQDPVRVASVLTSCRSLQDCVEECSKGHPAACLEAGRLYEYGHGAPADTARAYQAYDRSCTLGYAGGCYNAALLLESGHGVQKDVVRAQKLYAAVCELGGRTACARRDALAGTAAAITPP